MADPVSGEAAGGNDTSRRSPVTLCRIGVRRRGQVAGRPGWTWTTAAQVIAGGRPGVSVLNFDKVVTSSEKPPASSGEGCQVITCTVVAATGTDAHRGAVREASAKVMGTYTLPR